MIWLVAYLGSVVFVGLILGRGVGRKLAEMGLIHNERTVAVAAGLVTVVALTWPVALVREVIRYGRKQ